MKDLKNLSVDDYLRIFLRRIWYFVITAIVVGGAAVYVAWKVPNVYLSQTTIEVKSQAVPEELVKSSVRMTVEEQLSVVRQQISSHSVMEKVREQLRVAALNSLPPDLTVATMLRSVRIPTRSVAPNTLTIGYEAEEPRVARDVLKTLTEEIVRINTSARGERALEADRFIDEHLLRAERALVEHEGKMRDFRLKHFGELPEQSTNNLNALNTLNGQLAANEGALQRLQDQRTFLDTRLQDEARMSLLVQNLPQRHSPPTAGPIARAESREVQTTRAAIDLKKKELISITARYTSKHPDVTRLMKEVDDLERGLQRLQQADNSTPSAEIAASTPLGQDAPSSTVPASQDPSSYGAELRSAELRSQLEINKRDVAKLEKQREQVLQQIKTHQGRLNMAPQLEQELATLAREHESLKQTYQNLQGKKLNADMTTSLETDKSKDTVKIIEEANLPEVPAQPDRFMLLVAGCGAGLLLGVGMVVVRELFDPTFSNEEEAAAELKLPILISIPEISVKELAQSAAADSGRSA